LNQHILGNVSKKFFEEGRVMDLYNKALELIPWGVQTGSKRPDFLFFGEGPVYVKKAFGSRIVSIDGKEYIDYIMALGAVILGYNIESQIESIEKVAREYILTSLSSPLEVKVAEKIVKVIPSAEMVRFFKTGAEATSAAVRVSRYYTGRDKIMACGYFGWHDWANKGEGIPKRIKELTKWFNWENLDYVEKELKSKDYAAVIVEPVMGDNPSVEKLKFLRSLTEITGTILIFDEIKTGFRFLKRSAQAYFNIVPDLTVLGKAVANGMPLSVLCGKKEFMKAMEHIWISTTYGSEALSLAAANYTINFLTDEKIEELWNLGKKLIDGLKEIVSKNGVSGTVIGYPVMNQIKFSKDEDEKIFIRESMKLGVLFKRGGYNFVSLSHTEEDIEKSLDVADVVLKKLQKGG